MTTNIDSTLDYLELNRMCQFKDIYRRRLSRSMLLSLRRKIFTVCKQAQGLELLFENQNKTNTLCSTVAIDE